MVAAFSIDIFHWHFQTDLEGNIKTSTFLIGCQTHDSDRHMGSIDVN
jgi:hypothetical protein